MVKIGDRLKFLRQDRMVMKKDIISATGISNAAYYYYETNQNTPTSDVIIKLARFYQISTDYLLGVSNDPTIHDPVFDEESATLEPAI